MSALITRLMVHCDASSGKRIRWACKQCRGLMMKIFVGYASKEGQSRKIARYVADFAFETGHSIEISDLSDTSELNFDRFDAVLLVAPIHTGHYPKSLIQFVSFNQEQLNALPARFVSVSLAAAGYDAEDWRDLEHIVDDLGEATGWRPIDTKHVAGAYMPSKYDILTGFLMRRILAKRDLTADLSADKEYTDWIDLNAWINSWLNP